MARLSDISKIRRSIGLRAFARRVWDEMSADNLLVWASALAYSWLFAIFPFVIFLLALLPYLPSRVQGATKGEIKRIMDDQLPTSVNNQIWKEIDGNTNNPLLKHALHGPMLYGGLFVALWAASSGTSMTMSALDRCYELDRCRSIVRQRVMAIVLTIIVATLMIGIMCLLPLGTWIKDWLIRNGMSPGRPALLLFDISRWCLSLVLMVLILCLIYYNGPAIRHRFCLITPGAFFVVIVWVVLGILFRIYVDTIGARGYSQTYGTLGGVVILLFFFYLDALVLLLGAEINSEVDFEVLRVRRGSNDFRRPEDFSVAAPTSC